MQAPCLLTCVATIELSQAPSAPWPGSGSSQPFSLPDTTAVTADNHDHALSSGSLPSPPPTPQQYNDPNPAELSPIYEQTLPADVQVALF